MYFVGVCILVSTSFPHEASLAIKQTKLMAGHHHFQFPQAQEVALDHDCTRVVHTKFKRNMLRGRRDVGKIIFKMILDQIKIIFSQTILDQIKIKIIFFQRNDLDL
jgi:hypothetical protein